MSGDVYSDPCDGIDPPRAYFNQLLRPGTPNAFLFSMLNNKDIFSLSTLVGSRYTAAQVAQLHKTGLVSADLFKLFLASK